MGIEGIKDMNKLDIPKLKKEIEEIIKEVENNIPKELLNNSLFDEFWEFAEEHAEKNGFEWSEEAYFKACEKLALKHFDIKNIE